MKPAAAGLPTAVAVQQQRGAASTRGNTVIVAEHEMSVAAASDWIIDMGPGAGDGGGRVVAAGTPADIASNPSRTGIYLKRLFGLSLAAAA